LLIPPSVWLDSFGINSGKKRKLRQLRRITAFTLVTFILPNGFHFALKCF
jgi:hypothetical protein